MNNIAKRIYAKVKNRIICSLHIINHGLIISKINKTTAIGTKIKKIK